jgi:hypothetical protein
MTEETKTQETKELLCPKVAGDSPAAFNKCWSAKKLFFAQKIKKGKGCF